MWFSQHYIKYLARERDKGKRTRVHDPDKKWVSKAKSFAHLLGPSGIPDLLDHICLLCICIFTQLCLLPTTRSHYLLLFYFYNFAPKLTISAAAVVINEQIQPPNLLILGWGSHLNLVKTWVEFKLCLMFECLIFNPSSYHQRFIHWFEPTVNLVISYDFMPLFCEFCKMSPWF